jgi:predicted transcriptional regulator
MAQRNSRRDSNGRFVSDAPQQILNAMPSDGTPVIASEIADQIQLSNSTVNYHLNNLADDDRVCKKKFHEKRVVWWLDTDT